MPKKVKAKAAPKKKESKKTTKPDVAKKIKAIKNAYSKAQLMTAISETTELPKKKVVDVFNALGDIMEAHLKKNGAGNFTLPGVAKFVTKRMPAKKARKGINPFNGEEIMIKAKPAKNVVKIRPLKKLKDKVA